MVEQSRLSKVFGSKPATPASVQPAPARKPVSQAQSQAKPSSGGGGGSAGGGAGGAGGEVKQITIAMPTIAIRIDDRFKAKLPFLLLMLLLFAFSLVLFEKANFHAIDIVDIGRLQYNISKLWSVSFLLFLLLYSFAVALAMFYGFGQNWGSTLFVVIPALVIAVAASLFYPASYFLVFIALGVTLAAAALVASFRTQVKFSSIYSTAGTALLVLVVLSFFIAFNHVSANKDSYIDTFIASGVTTSVAQMQGASLSSVLTPDLIRGAVTKQQFESMITEARVAKYLEGIPAFAALNASAKAQAVAAIRAKVASDLYAGVQTDLPILLSNVRLGESNAASQSLTANSVKQTLGQTPAFVAFYDNFSLLTALFIASFVAVFTFIIKIISTLLCWLLAKL